MKTETDKVVEILRELSNRVGARLRQAEDHHQAALQRAETAHDGKQAALEKRHAGRWALEAAAHKRAVQFLFTCISIAKEEKDVIRTSTS